MAKRKTNSTSHPFLNGGGALVPTVTPTSGSLNNYTKLVESLQNSIQLRLVASNQLTFQGKIEFRGNDGWAKYAPSAWRAMFEVRLRDAINQFLSQVRGSTSPEGKAVSPTGFAIDFKVSQQMVAPSVIVEMK